MAGPRSGALFLERPGNNCSLVHFSEIFCSNAIFEFHDVALVVLFDLHGRSPQCQCSV
jgi:hypothetical protein